LAAQMVADAHKKFSSKAGGKGKKSNGDEAEAEPFSLLHKVCGSAPRRLSMRLYPCCMVCGSASRHLCMRTYPCCPVCGSAPRCLSMRMYPSYMHTRRSAAWLAAIRKRAAMLRLKLDSLLLCTSSAAQAACVTLGMCLLEYILMALVYLRMCMLVMHAYQDRVLRHSQGSVSRSTVATSEHSTGDKSCGCHL